MKFKALLLGIISFILLTINSTNLNAQQESINVLPGRVEIKLASEIPSIALSTLHLNISDLTQISTEEINEFRQIGITRLMRANPSVITHPGLGLISSDRVKGHWILEIPDNLSPIEVAERLD